MMPRRVLACVVALALAVPSLAPAQTGPPPAPFKAEELDQLVAPIALYPDPLVAQILMASTYPLEIVQAARFAKENASLTGGASGVMTFIVNHEGVVYQKDLGPSTAAIARAMKRFNPDRSWKKA